MFERGACKKSIFSRLQENDVKAIEIDDKAKSDSDEENNKYVEDKIDN